MEFEGDILKVGRSHQATKWTVEVLAGALVGLKEDDQPINPRYLSLKHDTLYGRITDRSGGWAKIVALAGYNPNEERKQKERKRMYILKK